MAILSLLDGASPEAVTSRANRRLAPREEQERPNEADLPQHRNRVSHRPVLHDLPVLEPADGDAAELHAPPIDQPRDGEPRRDDVILDDLLLDTNRQVLDELAVD